MLRKPRVLILTFTPFAREPRALKQMRRLSSDYDVTTAGFGAAPDPSVPHIELDPAPSRTGLYRIPALQPLLLLFRQYRFVSRHMPVPEAAYQQLHKIDWDVIVAHDVATIAVANRLAPRRGVLSDLHEYAPRQNEHSFLWRLLIAPYFRWLIRNEVSHAAEVTTVSQGIVDEYASQFGLKSSLVINATPFRSASPLPSAEPIRLVHSGIPGRARKLEVMIEGVKSSTANVLLDLYLMPTDPEHLAELQALAKGDPRISFKTPVPYADLLETLATYDVGISLIAPTTFNLEYCLPNKFFDFIQARLAVVTGPSVEMMGTVERYGIGAVTKDFSAAAFSEVLNSLTPEQVTRWKRASDVAAHELTAESQVEVWAAAVSRIASAPERH